MSRTNNRNNAIHDISQGCVNAAHHLIAIAGGLDRLPQYLEQFQGPPRKKKRKPRSPDMPKLPKSAYLLYSMEHRPEAREETDRGKASDVVTLLAQKWQALSPEEKEPYAVKATQEKERYEKEMMIYRANHPAANDQAEGSAATLSTVTNGNDDDNLSSYTDEEDDEPLPKDNGDDDALPQDDDQDDDSSQDDESDLSSDEDDESVLSSDDDDGSHVPTKDHISDTESSDDSDVSASIIFAPQKHKMPKHIVTKQNNTVVKPKDTAIKPKDAVTKPKEKVTKPKEKVTKPKEKVTKPKPKKPVKSSVKQSSMKNSDKSPKDKGKQPMIKKNNVKQNDKIKQTIMDKKAGQIQTAKQGVIKKNVDKRTEKGKQPMNVMKRRPSSSTNDQQPSKKAKMSKTI